MAVPMLELWQKINIAQPNRWRQQVMGFMGCGHPWKIPNKKWEIHVHCTVVLSFLIRNIRWYFCMWSGDIGYLSLQESQKLKTCPSETSLEQGQVQLWVLSKKGKKLILVIQSPFAVLSETASSEWPNLGHITSYVLWSVYFKTVFGQYRWHVARNGNSVIKYWCPKFMPSFWSLKDPACCSRSLIGVVSWSNGSHGYFLGMMSQIVLIRIYGFMCWYCGLCHLGSLQDIYGRYESVQNHLVWYCRMGGNPNDTCIHLWNWVTANPI